MSESSPPRLSFRAVLDDGTPVLLRPIRPGDNAGLRAGFARLSARSRRHRFLHQIEELSAKDAAYLTEIDYRDHMAWVALDLSGREPQGVGVARYVRCADDPQSAEIAVTVVDSHQARGLGSLLLRLLSGSAAESGIAVFRGTVAEENRAILGLLQRVGARVEPVGDGTLDVSFPVPSAAAIKVPPRDA